MLHIWFFSFEMTVDRFLRSSGKIVIRAFIHYIVLNKVCSVYFNCSYQSNNCLFYHFIVNFSDY